LFAEMSYWLEASNNQGSSQSATFTVLPDPPQGIFVSETIARTTQLPDIEGSGSAIDVFNGIGGDEIPLPSDLVSLTPSGSTLSPVVDFPSPGDTVNLGDSFDLFFNNTTRPPEQISGLSARNFIMRLEGLLRISSDLDLHPETPEIDVSLNVGSDDGYHLTLGSVFIGNTGRRPFTYTNHLVSFQSEGLYPYQLLFAANAEGHSGLEFSWQTGEAPSGEIIPQSHLYLRTS